MTVFQGLNPFLNLLIEARQRLGLQVNRLLALANGERGSINRRNVQKHKVPSATGVELFNYPEVLVHKLVMEVIKVLVPVAVANVIDADPESEKTVGGFPRRERGLLAKDWEEKTLDLVFKRENGGRIGRDKIGVDCGAAWNCQLPGTWFWDLLREERTIGQVVRQEFGLVELHRQVIDPCRSTKSTVSRVLPA